MSMTAKERAAAIRNTLKTEHGWTSRQVSVRSDRNSIGVTIKDAAVSEAIVTRIAEAHETIRRCEMTGDILGGGNTFVTVSWDNSVLDAIAERFNLDQVPEDGTNHEIGRIVVWRDQGTWLWTIQRGEGETWEENNEIDSALRRALGSNLMRCWDDEATGRAIARAILHLGRDLDREPVAADHPSAAADETDEPTCSNCLDARAIPTADDREFEPCPECNPISATTAYGDGLEPMDLTRYPEERRDQFLIRLLADCGYQQVGEIPIAQAVFGPGGSGPFNIADIVQVVDDFAIADQRTRLEAARAQIAAEGEPAA